MCVANLIFLIVYISMLFSCDKWPTSFAVHFVCCELLLLSSLAVVVMLQFNYFIMCCSPHKRSFGGLQIAFALCATKKDLCNEL